MKWHDWMRALLEIFFPREFICPLCWRKGQSRDNKGFCDSCVNKVLSLSREIDTCPRCGYFKADQACPNCYNWENTSLEVVSVVPYYGMFKELIYNLKYNGKKDIIYPLGCLMAKRIEELEIKEKIKAVIPVPLHFSRENARGFNQSLLLAKEVATELGKPLLENVIKRNNFRYSQTRLRKKGRFENIAGAFEGVNKQEIVGKTILIVDDIITTGATLMACAKALEQMGAIKVYGVTWAAGYNIKIINKIAGNWLYSEERRG